MSAQTAAEIIFFGTIAYGALCAIATALFGDF
jgi:hypothetical protein